MQYEALRFVYFDLILRRGSGSEPRKDVAIPIARVNGRNDISAKLKSGIGALELAFATSSDSHSRTRNFATATFDATTTGRRRSDGPVDRKRTGSS